jgi:hypothetical protein
MKRMRKRENISEWETEEKYLNDEANEKARKNIWMRDWGKISEWWSEWESERKYLNERLRKSIWMMKRMRKREKISEWEKRIKQYLEIYSSFILVVCMSIRQILAAD